MWNSLKRILLDIAERGADGGYYNGQGGFGRIGMDLAVVKKGASENNMLVGLRFGGAYQNYDLTNVKLYRVKQRFGIIGNAEALNNALEVAMRVAPTELSVLVTGESGVGKEFFPQVIHAYSARKHNKYIAVNCGAIPEGTIDSELFGHEKARLRAQ